MTRYRQENMKSVARLFLLCLFGLVSLGIQAHPMAPGLWALHELPSEQVDTTLFQVTWKTSLKPLPGVKPDPVFPEGCHSVSAPVSTVEGTGKVVRWRVRCDWAELSQQVFGVEGIKGSPVGVLLRVSLRDGRHYHHMLSSEANHYRVPEQPNAWQVAKNYLLAGAEHLMVGIDHVLFVIVLALLVGWGAQLVWTITLFTFGHSLTLALAVLGYVNFPSMLVEALIALSIAVAAVEVVKRDNTRLFARRPWLMSGGFGLLHGMGFAGVLSEVGLPVGDIPLALAAFNVGIEIGQLLVIAVFFALLALLQRLPVPRQSLLLWRMVPVYVIGTVATMWFWQRLGLEVVLLG